METDGKTAGPSATMLLDIAPTTAFTQSSAVFSLAASRGMRFVFMGGEDGFIRKYDFEASLTGSTLLTSGQRHMLPDSVTKAGILSAFWENEQLMFQNEYKVSNDGFYTPQLSPVYSLAAQSEALWVASGLESGDIRIQSATYGELGQVLAYLRGHKKTVSDLKLSATERLLLSGSWDKTVACWDLEKGIAIAKYRDLSSQVSSVDWQAAGAVSVEYRKETKPDEEDQEDDDKSLFGSDDEGSKDGERDSSGNDGVKKDDEDNREDKDEKSSEKDQANSNEQSAQQADQDASNKTNNENDNNNNDDKSSNIHNDEQHSPPLRSSSTAEPKPRQDSNVFMSSTFNGHIDIWDIRQKERAATLSGSQAPPWCISACFSYDGNHIFAGRRNACVEDYDLRTLSRPLRNLKFPTVSGSVSCVTAMPDNETLLCASYDNIRLYDLKSTRKTPFSIIAGHHGSMISRMLVDASGKYIVSSTGGRGWTDTAIDSALAYEVGYED